LITPPDTRGNVQRIFVPKSALNKLMVLSVVGGTRTVKPAKTPIAQEALFDE